MQALFEKNREWAEKINKEDPNFFPTLSKQQSPEYLWIGCSDSRVPANQIVGMMPGEVFVHRNIANQVIHTDLNCLSVMQYAVDVLKVKHVMVVGHYGCGGVKAAMDKGRFGLIDNWLRHIQDVETKHLEKLKAQPEAEYLDRLIELNVIEQVQNVCRTTILQDAWLRNQDVTVHGWVYGLKDGIISDLKCSIDSASKVDEVIASACHNRMK